MRQISSSKLGLLAILIVLALSSKALAEEAPAASWSCFTTRRVNGELAIGRCDQASRCYIAKLNPQRDQNEYKVEAGCITDKGMLNDARLNDWDKCNLVATPFGKSDRSQYSHICTCNEDKCNTGVIKLCLSNLKGKFSV